MVFALFSTCIWTWSSRKDFTFSFINIGMRRTCRLWHLHCPYSTIAQIIWCVSRYEYWSIAYLLLPGIFIFHYECVTSSLWLVVKVILCWARSQHSQLRYCMQTFVTIKLCSQHLTSLQAKMARWGATTQRFLWLHLRQDTKIYFYISTHPLHINHQPF